MAFGTSWKSPTPTELMAPPSAQAPEVEHIPSFLPSDEADAFFQQLRHELSFAPDELLIHGQKVVTRRQVDYRSDPGAHYTYSNAVKAAKVWTPALARLRELTEARVGARFNACLCNLYESGEVGMGWHADKERELGDTPVIASLSLGQAREFKFRWREPWRQERKQIWKHMLGSGDLLIMRGATQRYFEHTLAPSAKALAPRINLTFRQVLLP